MVFCNDKMFQTFQTIKIVTILILIDGFLQYIKTYDVLKTQDVTILILIDGFLQSYFNGSNTDKLFIVTILILIDGFLQ